LIYYNDFFICQDKIIRLIAIGQNFNICEPLVKSNQDALAIALQSPDLVEAGFMHAGTIKSRTNKKSRFYLML